MRPVRKQSLVSKFIFHLSLLPLTRE
uniref:Uncharacterized protein n=1 Tax=Rhizophora mucronata TaxID=61149 RepID=A0A2P2NBZ1_RHIMU